MGRGEAGLPKKLVESLEPGETVVGYVKQSGLALEKPKWLVVTDRRLIVFDEKLLGRYELVSVPYERLRRVYFRKGIVASEFIIELEDGSKIELPWMNKEQAEEAIRLIKRALEAVAVEPPTIIRKKHLTSEEVVLDKPKELLARGVTAPGQPRRALDPLEELERLKKLLDEGAITLEEYQKLKERILRQLTA